MGERQVSCKYCAGLVSSVAFRSAPGSDLEGGTLDVTLTDGHSLWRAEGITGNDLLPHNPRQVPRVQRALQALSDLADAPAESFTYTMRPADGGMVSISAVTQRDRAWPRLHYPTPSPSAALPPPPLQRLTVGFAHLTARSSIHLNLRLDPDPQPGIAAILSSLTANLRQLRNQREVLRRQRGEMAQLANASARLFEQHVVGGRDAECQLYSRLAKVLNAKKAALRELAGQLDADTARRMGVPPPAVASDAETEEVEGEEGLEEEEEEEMGGGSEATGGVSAEAATAASEGGDGDEWGGDAAGYDTDRERGD